MEMESKGCHVSVGGRADWPFNYHVIEYFNLDVPVSSSEPGGEVLDCSVMIGSDRAFPDNCNPPTHFSKCRNSGGIPFPVPRELVIPELRSCLGQAEVRASLMPVPEASVHEDGRLPLGQDEIWSPGKLPAMETETVATLPEQSPHNQFRLGVFGLDP